MSVNAILEKASLDDKADWSEAITVLTSLLSNKQSNAYLANIAPPSQKKDRFTDLILYFDIVRILCEGNALDHSVPSLEHARHFAVFSGIRAERAGGVGVHGSNLLPDPLL